jgi:Ca2+-binding RTX toxin-like protein
LPGTYGAGGLAFVNFGTIPSASLADNQHNSLLYFGVHSRDAVETGDSGTFNVTVTFNRSGYLADAVSANYAIDLGAFDPGNVDIDDFSGAQPLTGTVNFLAGQDAASITLTFDNDNFAEGTELLTVGYTGVLSGSGAYSTALTTVRVLDDDNGTAASETLKGSASSDAIYSNGGDDLMIGGTGNDSYHVDSAHDVVTENSGAGSDTIYVSLSYTNAANVERLILSGSGDFNAAGLNGQNDILVGNSGNNILNGRTGGDNMSAGQGDDFYYVNTSADVVNETSAAGSGFDTIFSMSGYTIAANVERLYLLGTANYNANGRNGQNDFLAGNSGANIINGMSGDDVKRGGLGNDILTGGGGMDVFQFLTRAGSITNMDAITDFNAADDTIQLDNLYYAALGANGSLTPGTYNTGTEAVEADDRIIYDTGTGALLYDADGSGAGGAVQFALLTGAPVISAADFMVV